jgi:hypothetical protein
VGRNLTPDERRIIEPYSGRIKILASILTIVTMVLSFILTIDAWMFVYPLLLIAMYLNLHIDLLYFYLALVTGLFLPLARRHHNKD